MTEGATLVKNMNSMTRHLKFFENAFRETGRVDERSINAIQTLYVQIANDLTRNRDIADEILELECQFDSDRTLILAVFGGGQNKLGVEWMRLRWRLGNINEMTGKTLITEPEIGEEFD